MTQLHASEIVHLYVSAKYSFITVPV